jgi:plastocyanin
VNRLAMTAVLLLVAACSNNTAGTTGTTTGAADAQTVTVEMTDKLRFTPSTVEAKVGTVTFDVSNTGQVPHDLQFDAKGLGDTGTIDGKEARPLKVVFTKAGTFTFICTFHAAMKGKVVVS